MKLTQRNIESLSLPEQSEQYWRHNQVNLQDNNRRPSGPSMMAQVAFWNDWRKALSRWKETLSS